MLTQLNRNLTRMVRTRFSWRPSETALRTAGMMFVGGAILALCTFPAWAAATPSAAEQGGSGFRTAGFMLFVAGMSLAPLLVLVSATLARMAMLKSGWEQEWEFEYPRESEPEGPFRNPFFGPVSRCRTISLEWVESKFAATQLPHCRWSFPDETSALDRCSDRSSDPCCSRKCVRGDCPGRAP